MLFTRRGNRELVKLYIIIKVVLSWLTKLVWVKDIFSSNDDSTCTLLFQGLLLGDFSKILWKENKGPNKDNFQQDYNHMKREKNKQIINTFKTL